MSTFQAILVSEWKECLIQNSAFNVDQRLIVVIEVCVVGMEWKWLQEEWPRNAS